MAFGWNPLTWSRGVQRDQAEYDKRLQPREARVQNNASFGAFSNIDPGVQAIVNSRSVISQTMRNQNANMANPTWSVQFGDDLLAVPVATNKRERIQMYRRIAAYPVCKWCLEEIADDFIHDDENGDFITMKLPQRLNSEQQTILQNEFHKYINLFNFRDDGYNLIKRFLTEGELAWENVIKPEYPTLGIVAVRFMPAEYYETLVDPESAEPVGILFDTDQYSDDRRQLFSNQFQSAATIFNSISPMGYNFSFAKETSVPMLWSQVTYVSSGDHSDDYTVSYPLIENAKQQYHRLALLEDSAIILRVTHAPERLLFNVSTGKMNQNHANEFVRRFATELKSKKVATPGGEDIMGVYNPVTMIKNYVFGRSDGNDGTSVESVGSSASYDQMDDIEYFLRAMIKQFKVPWSRYKTPENTMEKNDAISYEEYAFSRMILRFQRRFAAGFKRGFITHLKLRKLWDKEEYELKESEIDIAFVKPVLYDLYETQKLVDTKMNIYKSFADQDEISKICVMKKYLGYTDKDIEENFNSLIREKQLVAAADYFAELIKEDNPPVDLKSPLRLKKDVDTMEAAALAGTSQPDENTSDGGEDAEPSPDAEPVEEAPADDTGDEGSFGLS